MALWSGIEISRVGKIAFSAAGLAKACPAILPTRLRRRDRTAWAKSQAMPINKPSAEVAILPTLRHRNVIGR